jgi:threonine/homoserine/homoserine lactone efflux protein
VPLAEAVLAAPVRWGQAGSLVLSSLAIMGSPGPATISLTAVGSAYGVRRCAGYLAGIIAGTTAVLVAVAAGITAALLAVPALRVILVAASAFYILWLAYHIATAPPLTSQAPKKGSPSLAGGALLGIANPKAWIAIASVYASAHLAAGAVTDAAAKTAALTGMIIVINATWLIGGASLAPLLRDPRWSRAINVTLAVAVVGATALAIVHQSW